MVKTRILIISDTHGAQLAPAGGPSGAELEALLARGGRAAAAQTVTAFRDPLPEADVVLHCGDLTLRSRPAEYRATFAALRAARAPLKLAIAGNHDSALDERYFVDDMGENPSVSAEVRGIIADAEQDGVKYLTEGVYSFNLANGARLTVYASPWTPMYGGWGFQYPDGTHSFDIPPGVDVAMTHGPPRSVLDFAGRAGTRAGCPDLFRAVHRARPKIHCFGHIHESWGAFLAGWKQRSEREQDVARETVIDEAASRKIKELTELWPSPIIGNSKTTAKKAKALAEIMEAGGFYVDTTEGETRLVPGEQTLFVNAAIMDIRYRPRQLPWIVDIDLPAA